MKKRRWKEEDKNKKMKVRGWKEEDKRKEIKRKYIKGRKWK